MHVYIPASPGDTESTVYVVDVFSLLTSVDVFSVLTLAPFRNMVLSGLGTPLDIHVMVTLCPSSTTGSGVTVKDVMLGLITTKEENIKQIYTKNILLVGKKWKEISHYRLRACLTTLKRVICACSTLFHVPQA